MKIRFVLLLLAPVFAFAQRDYSSMPVAHNEIAPGVHRLYIGQGVSVTAFTGQDGILLIDAGYEQTTRQLMDTLKRIDQRPVTYLINTHLHGDHTGGNAVAGNNATIIAHSNTKAFLMADRKPEDQASPSGLPTITFDNEMRLQFNGQELLLKHLPAGHTNSDIIVYFPESNVVVTGDLLFAGFFPFIDLNRGGTLEGYFNNVRWLIDTYNDQTIFIGGHGPAFSRAQLSDWITTLRETVTIIRQAQSKGMNADEIKKARLLQKWESFGSFFITADRWIDTVLAGS